MNPEPVFVAIISRDNVPLVLRDLRGQDDTAMHFVVYSALDTVDEKSNIDAVRHIVGGKFTETFLGYLGPTMFPHEDFSMYGAVDYTGVKFVLLLQETHDTRKEDDIKAVRVTQYLKALMKLHQDTVLNPFYRSAKVFSSTRFLRKLDGLTALLSHS